MKVFSLKLLLISLLIATSGMFAQIRVGVLGGLNLAGLSVKQDGNNLEGVEHPGRTTFGAGGVMLINLPGTLELQVEPGYLMQGSKYTVNGQESGNFQLGYLNVPVMIRYNKIADNVGPFFAAGPNIGFLLSANHEAPDGVKTDIKSDLKSMDIGLNFTTGIGAPLSSGTLFIQAQFGLGVINIDDSVAAENGLTRKTSSIKIMLGFLFGEGE